MFKFNVLSGFQDKVWSKTRASLYPFSLYVVTMFSKSVLKSASINLDFFQNLPNNACLVFFIALRNFFLLKASFPVKVIFLILTLSPLSIRISISTLLVFAVSFFVVKRTLDFRNPFS